MPIPGWLGESYELAQENVGRIQILLLAQSAECSAVQSLYPLKDCDWSVTRISMSDLADLALKDSWFMAVLVCPGDGLDDLIQWAKWLDRPEARRIQFFARPSVEEDSIEDPWIEAGLPFTGVVRFSGFKDFHPEFARAVLEHVMDDWGP